MSVAGAKLAASVSKCWAVLPNFLDIFGTHIDEEE
jgi:hypothetical protein